MAYRLGTVGKVLMALIVTFGVLAAQAEAVAVLTFDQTVDGGTVAYAGGAAAAIGTDVAFDLLVASGTPLNAGTYGCSGCTLNFTTGANTSNTPLGGGVRSYTWGGGAGTTFVLTGTVFNPSDLSVIASGTLLTGTFIGAQATTVVVPDLVGPPPVVIPDIINFTAQGIDRKHPDLIEFFGVESNAFIFSNFEGSAQGTIGAGGSFSGVVDEADLINSEGRLPEPGGVMLLLLGLASLAVYRNRLS